MSTYRDPTFEIVAAREAREQRRQMQQAEKQAQLAKIPNTIRWTKRLRIRELVKGVLR